MELVELILGPCLFLADGAHLGGELVLWPIWIADQVQEAVNLGAQCHDLSGELGTHEAAGSTAVRHGRIHGCGDPGTQACGEGDSGVVVFDGPLDVGSPEVWQVAGVLLPTGAQEVEILLTRAGLARRVQHAA
ncbi:hypothetical protein [Catenulispora sp. MAP5-51]|uniref:hypothetical protein n=1 Tax=Catenulispora sp. MAP5-51 TaxID=3156298 RepID=UPI003517177A